jgi:trehalose utilization protein
MSIKVAVWNENRHEKKNPKVPEIYPYGVHGVISDYLGKDKEFDIITATLDDKEHGLTQEEIRCRKCEPLEEL